MKYMLLFCRDENIELDTEETARIPAAAEAWVKEMNGRGVRLEGNTLAAISEAITVRVRDGEVLIADGPVAETKEQIAASTFWTAPISTRRWRWGRSIPSPGSAPSR